MHTDRMKGQDGAIEAAQQIAAVPKHLYDCSTIDMQKAWIKRALLSGRVLSDSGLWLGGVDRPEQIMRSLRAEGMAVVTTKKKVVDAEGKVFKDLAWRLAT